MKIHFYTIYDDYRFTIESPVELEDLPGTVDYMTRTYFERKIYKAFPQLKDEDIEIRFDWLYDGYKLFIIGVELTDFQISKLCHYLNDANCVDRQTYLNLATDDYRKYTGLTLGYDIANYYRINVDRLIVYMPSSPSDSLMHAKNNEYNMPEYLQEFFADAKIYRDFGEIEIQKKKLEMQQGKTELLYRASTRNGITNI